MTKRFGFTLAEVLITLGIIGVVAAMTIPTLIANTNGAKFRSQFKKTLSTLNQAGLMAQAQYDFDYSGTSAACTDASDDPLTKMTFCSLLNGTLTGYTYVADPAGLKRGDSDYTITKQSANLTAMNSNTYHAYQLADGALVAFKNTVYGCTVPIGTALNDTKLQTAGTTGASGINDCVGFIDVNGVTLPNKEVTCATATDTKIGEGTCEVTNDAAHMTDIFPVVFHDATVEPASNAARYVLTTSK